MPRLEVCGIDFEHDLDQEQPDVPVLVCRFCGDIIAINGGTTQ